MAVIKIANAPCSWGVLEFDLQGKAAGYEQVLDEIAATGYVGTELGDWGFMPTDPVALKKEITKRGLTLLGAFVPVALSKEESHETGESAAIRVAHLMKDAGYDRAFIVLADDNGSDEYRTKHAGRIQQKDGLNDDKMQTFAKGANRIAKAVKDQTGLRTVFHHHCAGYIETPEEIDRLMQATDPSLLGLCFDTGHYLFGGGVDPLTAMNKYKDRIWHIHYKDYSAEVGKESSIEDWDYFESVKHGVFCELGKGEVDFKAVTESLQDSNYNGWIVVEQDVLPGMGDPKQCASKNRQYLQSLSL